MQEVVHLSVARRFLALFAVSAALPALAAAGELTNLHPTEACAEQKVAAGYADELVDMVLAQVGLAPQPEPFVDKIDAIGIACAQQHGVPDRNARLFGNYLASKVMRDEAHRRLGGRGFELAWLDGVLAERSSRSKEDAQAMALGLVQQMDREGRFGQATSGEELAMTRGLVFVYVYGNLAMGVASAQLGG